MKYSIFFTGLCSTPFTIGLINYTTGEKIHEIDIRGEKSKDMRNDYEKRKSLLESKYKSILN